MAVITVSREFGSGGETLARRVAEKLGFLLVNKKTITEGLQSIDVFEPDLDMDERAVQMGSDDLYSKYISCLHEYLYELSNQENLVLLGRGGQILFKDFDPSYHVKIISPLEKRISRIMRLYNLREEAALKLVREQDENKKQYLRQIFDEDWMNMELYDLVLNTGGTSLETSADIIATAYQLQYRDIESGISEEAEITPEEITFPQEEEAQFMHPSEEEFAKMLDFYRIKWEYEPRTFPLEWDSEGNISEAFTPDFYLPEQDLYVEITTQRQKLVWKKNKKVRRLKELYPDVNIKIIYHKDYKSLLRRFDLEEED
ncbi:MAG: hypothetical protein D5R97_03175 [Candidatus Syntrophonatronum acetioxidans]|uniref:Cytidylate kinase-like family protein n=1 Tax=Candidatus Syntrophonatronum acetioxidans TaxID=1795816 RepID=A0A424YGH1_9FIRM|nr:MAG: hypothetical protein D5R97_03175 [Candidatus Syntrophonatronum acetioxidans]